MSEYKLIQEIAAELAAFKGEVVAEAKKTCNSQREDQGVQTSKKDITRVRSDEPVSTKLNSRAAPSLGNVMVPNTRRAQAAENKSEKVRVAQAYGIIVETLVLQL